MKIKADFVTNSSSSSFVVMGNCIEIDLLPKEIIDTESDGYQISHYECIEVLMKDKKHDLSYSFGPPDSDSNQLMIGICYTNMKEDETLKQFKDRIQIQIANIFGIDKAPYHIEEAWEDR